MDIFQKYVICLFCIQVKQINNFVFLTKQFISFPVEHIVSHSNENNFVGIRKKNVGRRMFSQYLKINGKELLLNT